MSSERKSNKFTYLSLLLERMTEISGNFEVFGASSLPSRVYTRELPPPKPSRAIPCSISLAWGGLNAPPDLEDVPLVVSSHLLQFAPPCSLRHNPDWIIKASCEVLLLLLPLSELDQPLLKNSSQIFDETEIGTRWVADPLA